MADINDVKRFFKDAKDSDAEAAFQWVRAAMEVRGLAKIEGTRKRRSDAGKPRAETPAEATADGQMKLQEPGK